MADYDLGTARGRIEIDASGAEEGVDRSSRAIKGFQGGLDSAANSMVRVGGVMTGVGVAAVAGFGLAVNAAANFEQRMSAISAVTGATGEDLEKLRQLALKLGADTKFSAGEAALALEELGKAGIPLPDILSGAAKAVTDLAAAGEVALPRAAEITANAMNAFGIAGSDAARIADVFAAAANTSAADVEELGQSLQQVSAVAKIVGLSFEDTITALSMFADVGLKGSDAGTSLKTALLNLQPTTDKQKALFDQLGITTDGLNNKFFDQQGRLRSLAEVQKVLQDATAGMTQQQKLATLEQIGGTDAIRALSILTETSAERLGQYTEALQSNGQAGRTAAARMDNLKGSMEQLKGSVETAFIRIGQLGQGPVRQVVDFLNDLVGKFLDLSPAMQQNILIAIGLTAGLVGLMGTVILVGGFVIKFVKTMQDLRAAFKIIKELQMFSKAMTALNASFLTNPVFLVIAGLVLLGAALYLAYQRSEGFRKLVDSIWQGLQRLWDTILGAGMAVVNFFQNNWRTILAVLLPFVGIPLLIIENWDKIVAFFKALPGKIIGFLVEFVVMVATKLGELYNKFPEYLGMIWGFLIGFFLRLVGLAAQFAFDFYSSIVDFLIKLPGRLWDIFIEIVTNTASWISDMIGKAMDLGARFLNAIVEFFQQLPGRIWDFLSEAASNAASWVEDMAGKALDAGRRFFSGLIDGITGLPDAVRGILGRVIDAIKSMISQAFNAVKDFAAGLWNGFKKGLGIGSPSLIEYAMWDLVENVMGSVTDLRGQLLRMRKITADFGASPVSLSRSVDVRQGHMLGATATAAAGRAVNYNSTSGDTIQIETHSDADAEAIAFEMMWAKRVRVR